ncbi:hypothetical protein FNF28_04542 [Cafeteria roenbergensis]|uniref:Uncharacterized protein n=1 Tax=Cafeteria roenbergensis TaxID=33653 RepID=A0A5A8DC10_CAFRO|nr:hypothetical protein FNF28_04542 [Cafeteria roenbergensis]
MRTKWFSRPGPISVFAYVLGALVSGAPLDIHVEPAVFSTGASFATDAELSDAGPRRLSDVLPSGSILIAHEATSFELRAMKFTERTEWPAETQFRVRTSGEAAAACQVTMPSSLGGEPLVSINCSRTGSLKLEFDVQVGGPPAGWELLDTLDPVVVDGWPAHATISPPANVVNGFCRTVSVTWRLPSLEEYSAGLPRWLMYFAGAHVTKRWCDAPSGGSCFEAGMEATERAWLLPSSGAAGAVETQACAFGPNLAGKDVWLELRLTASNFTHVLPPVLVRASEPTRIRAQPLPFPPNTRAVFFSADPAAAAISCGPSVWGNSTSAPASCARLPDGAPGTAVAALQLRDRLGNQLEVLSAREIVRMGQVKAFAKVDPAADAVPLQVAACNSSLSNSTWPGLDAACQRGASVAVLWPASLGASDAIITATVMGRLVPLRGDGRLWQRTAILREATSERSVLMRPASEPTVAAGELFWVQLVPRDLLGLPALLPAISSDGLRLEAAFARISDYSGHNVFAATAFLDSSGVSVAGPASVPGSRIVLGDELSFTVRVASVLEAGAATDVLGCRLEDAGPFDRIDLASAAAIQLQAINQEGSWVTLNTSDVHVETRLPGSVFEVSAQTCNALACLERLVGVKAGAAVRIVLSSKTTAVALAAKPLGATLVLPPSLSHSVKLLSVGESELAPQARPGLTQLLRMRVRDSSAGPDDDALRVEVSSATLNQSASASLSVAPQLIRAGAAFAGVASASAVRLTVVNGTVPAAGELAQVALHADALCEGDAAAQPTDPWIKALALSALAPEAWACTATSQADGLVLPVEVLDVAGPTGNECVRGHSLALMRMPSLAQAYSLSCAVGGVLLEHVEPIIVSAGVASADHSFVDGFSALWQDLSSHSSPRLALTVRDRFGNPAFLTGSEALAAAVIIGAERSAIAVAASSGAAGAVTLTLNSSAALPALTSTSSPLWNAELRVTMHGNVSVAAVPLVSGPPATFAGASNKQPGSRAGNTTVFQIHALSAAGVRVPLLACDQFISAAPAGFRPEKLLSRVSSGVPAALLRGVQ